MKLILTVFAIALILAGTVALASAADVLDLSTLNKKQVRDIVTLPQVSPNMPTIAPRSLAGTELKDVLDLSTLGKKVKTGVDGTLLKGSNPITITPMFSIKNGNVSASATNVYTLPQAIGANPQVYTPPIAIFGGA